MNDEDNLQSEIFLAQADERKGPYTPMETPIIQRRYNA